MWGFEGEGGHCDGVSGMVVNATANESAYSIGGGSAVLSLAGGDGPNSLVTLVSNVNDPIVVLDTCGR